MKIKWNKVMSVVLIVAILLGSGNSVTANAKSKKVYLNRTKVTIYVGDTYQLTLNNTKKVIQWTSSKKKVASVSKLGLVTGKKQGTAWITATVGTVTYRCKVKVKTKVTKPTQNPIPTATPIRTIAPTVKPTATPGIKTPVPAGSMFKVFGKVTNMGGEILTSMKLYIYKKSSTPYEDDTVITSTDGGGIYQVLLAPGQYNIAIEKQYDYIVLDQVTVVDQKVNHPLKLDLNQVSGTLTNKEGTPVKNFQLQFLYSDIPDSQKNSSVSYCITDAKGRYSILLPKGSYYASERINETCSFKENFIVENKNKIQNFQFSSQICHITGTVKNEEGIALNEYEIMIYKKSADDTDIVTIEQVYKQDSFDITVEAGEYLVKIFTSNREKELGAISVKNSTVEINPVVQGFYFSGILKNRNFSPLKYNRVEIKDVNDSLQSVYAHTDQNGKINVFLFPGTYSVNFDNTEIETIKIEDKSITKDIIVNQFNVTGTILNKNGSPVSSQKFYYTLVSEKGNTTLNSNYLDEQGRYNISMAPGTCQIKITCNGTTELETFTVNDDMVKNFRLPFNICEVSGSISSHSGTYSESVTLSVYDANATKESKPITTLDIFDGMYSFKLKEGNYLLDVGEGWDDTLSHKFQVGPRNTEYNVKVNKTLVEGKVFGGNSEAITSGTIFIYDSSTKELVKSSVYTSEKGNYSFYVNPGKYLVKIKLNNLSYIQDEITVATSTVKKDFTVTDSTVTAKLVDKNGTLLSGNLVISDLQDKILMTLAAAGNIKTWMPKGTYHIKAIVGGKTYTLENLVITDSNVTKSFVVDSTYYMVSGTFDVKSERGMGLYFYKNEDTLFEHPYAGSIINSDSDNGQETTYEIMLEPGNYIVKVKTNDDYTMVGNVSVVDKDVIYSVKPDLQIVGGTIKSITNQSILSTKIEFIDLKTKVSYIDRYQQITEGYYSVSLPTGDYQVKVWLDKKSYDLGTYSVSPGKQKKDFVFTPEEVCVTGKVADQEDNNIYLYSIYYYNSDAKSDLDYVYSMTSFYESYVMWVPSGNYQVKIKLGDMYYSLGDVTVSNTNITQNYTLNSSYGTLTGTFSRPDALTLEVLILDKDGKIVYRSDLMNSNSFYVTLPTGDYKMEIIANGDVIKSKDLDITSGLNRIREE